MIISPQGSTLTPATTQWRFLPYNMYGILQGRDLGREAPGGLLRIQHQCDPIRDRTVFINCIPSRNEANMTNNITLELICFSDKYLMGPTCCNGFHVLCSTMCKTLLPAWCLTFFGYDKKNFFLYFILPEGNDFSL